LVVLGFELTPRATPPALFCDGVMELFALAGLKL
jgi:hypothetical protein